MGVNNNASSALAGNRDQKLNVLRDRLGALGDAHPLASLAKSMVDPVVIVLALYVLAFWFNIAYGTVLELLAILSFLLASLILDNTFLLLSESGGRWLGIGKVLCAWVWLSLLLMTICTVAGLLKVFPRGFLVSWLSWPLCSAC